MFSRSTLGGRSFSKMAKFFTASALLAATTGFAPGAFAQLDFDYDFESSSFPLNCSGNCPTTSTDVAREGKRSMKSYLNRKSSKTSYRTEAVIPGDKKKMTFERDYWIGFSTYLPNNWEHSNGLGMMAQIHATLDPGDTGGGPPFALKNGKGNWQILSRGQGRNMKTFTLNSAYEDVGRWVDWVVRYRPSYRGNGILQVWKDGTRLVNYSGNTAYNDKIGPYWKMGIYESWKDRNCCNDIPAAKVVYHDAFRIASGSSAGYNDVAPRGGSSSGGSTGGDSSSGGSTGGDSSSGGSTGGDSSSGGSSSGTYTNIIGPKDGSTVSGTITVRVDANDPKGMRKVVLWMGDKKIGTDKTAPYEFRVDTRPFRSSSLVRIKAVGHDSKGDTKRDTVKVYVK